MSEMLLRIEPRQETRQRLSLERILAEAETLSSYASVPAQALVEMAVRNRYRVLIVDPSETVREDGTSELRRRKWVVETAGNDADTRAALEQSQAWHAVLVNAAPSKDFTGAKLALGISAAYPEIPVISYTLGGPQEFESLVGQVRDTKVTPLRFKNQVLPARRTVENSATRTRARAQREFGLEGAVAGIYLRNLLPPNAMPLYFKLGGSTYDKGPEAVAQAVRNIIAAQERHGRPIFVSPGSGPGGDILKEWKRTVFRNYRNDPAQAYQLNQLAKNVLWFQARTLAQLFGDKAEILNPDHVSPDRRVVDYQSFEEKPIKIIPYAPKQMRITQTLPLEKVLEVDGEKIGELHLDYIFDSDVQTFAAAYFFGAQQVIFIKDTDRIYAKDPNVYGKDPLENPVIDEISCFDLLRATATATVGSERVNVQFSRIGGDNDMNHLCETAAAIYMYAFGPQTTFIAPWYEDWSKPGSRVDDIIAGNPGTSRIVRQYTGFDPEMDLDDSAVLYVDKPR